MNPYIALWGIAALSAMGYIGWVAANADRLMPPAPAALGESNEGQRTAADVISEIESIKSTVGNVQRDVAELKEEVAGSAETSLKLNNRIAALEEAPARAAQAAEAKAAPAPSAEPSKVTAAPAATPAKSAETKPAVVPKLINTAPEGQKSADEPKALETGSVAAASVAKAANKPAEASPIVFGPPVVKPAPKPIGIQIATGPSVDSLRLSWGLLADRHADTLKKLEARYVTGNDPSGTTYDLVAGPIKSTAEAKRICADLESKAVSCRVAGFEGNAL